MLAQYLLRLWHVRDDAVRYDEQDEVLGPVGALAGELRHVVDGGREVGGAVELDARHARLVRGHDACNQIGNVQSIILSKGYNYCYHT